MGFPAASFERPLTHPAFNMIGLAKIKYHLSRPESDRLRLVLNIGGVGSKWDWERQGFDSTPNYKHHLSQPDSDRLRLLLIISSWAIPAQGCLGRAARG